jgi:tetratricopeptide (TPR) repeat protein
MNDATESSGNAAIRERVRLAIELTREERYEDALEVFETQLPVLTEGDIQDRRIAASAFSYYGVCVAMVKRRYADAVNYCNVSLKANFMDADHRANLAMVYLERNEREKAIDTLHEGLRLQPRNRQIQKIFREIGRRRPPVLRFLPRDNPINVWLGRRRSEREKRSSGR